MTFPFPWFRPWSYSALSTAFALPTWNADGGTLENYSMRNVIPVTASGVQVRATFFASLAGAINIDNASIGIQSSGIITTATPVSFTFSGAANGSAIAGSSVTSDWLDFTVTSGTPVIVIVDFAATNGNSRRISTGVASAQSQHKAATNSYNVSSPTGFADLGNGYYCIGPLEVRSRL